MRILVTGASGFVGSALVPSLRAHGHEIVRLTRAPSSIHDGTVRWDPAAGTIDAAGLKELDAVVHLAGESIVGRWTPTKKAAIRDSRVQGTRLLCETLARLAHPPKTLVCASAIGYYGDRGDELLTEQSGPGTGFLAEVGQAWEAAAQCAAQAGLRVVHLRIGMVLHPDGGALAKMLPPFRLGLGGPMGSGRQHMSWIARDDLLDAIEHVLMAASLRGPVNAVAPHPVTNREFARVVGRVLGRPAFLPMPAFAVRLLFGDMGTELLVASARVEPARLLASSYRFRHPNLEDALRHMLHKEASP